MKRLIDIDSPLGIFLRPIIMFFLLLFVLNMMGEPVSGKEEEAARLLRLVSFMGAAFCEWLCQIGMRLK